MFDTRFKVSWDESVAQFTETIPWLSIAFAIMVASILTIWIIVYIGDFFLGSPMAKSYQAVRTEHTRYYKKTRQCGRSAGRLTVLMSAVIIGFGGMWVACIVAGVSFWNILFGYGVAALIMTYSFGPGLQSVGAYFFISLTNKVSENWYIEFIGMQVEGRITAINILWVELEYIDPKTGKFRDIFIPTTHFISSIYLRNFGKEEEPPAQLTHFTAESVNKSKLRAGVRLNV